MHGGIFCPLSASYFSIKCINMQKKYLDMQNSYATKLWWHARHTRKLQSTGKKTEKKNNKEILQKYQIPHRCYL